MDARIELQGHARADRQRSETRPLDQHARGDRRGQRARGAPAIRGFGSRFRRLPARRRIRGKRRRIADVRP